MPLTNQQLRDNYYVACVVWCCGLAPPYTLTDPGTGYDWDFYLSDSGGLPHPQPYIAAWDVKTVSRPTDSELEADVDMTMVADAISACYGAVVAKSPPVDASLAKRLASIEDRLAKLDLATPAPSAPPPAPTPAAPAPTPASVAPSAASTSAGSRRPSLDETGFDFMDDAEVSAPV